MSDQLKAENSPLNAVAGTGEMKDAQKQNSGSQVKDFGKLAICSIICGISCIGIFALINSVKAKKTREKDPETAQKYSQKAKQFGIISIVVWVTILLLTPLLIVLMSYLLTLIVTE